MNNMFGVSRLPVVANGLLNLRAFLRREEE